MFADQQLAETQPHEPTENRPPFLNYSPVTTFYVGLESIKPLVYAIGDGKLIRRGQCFKLFGKSPDALADAEPQKISIRKSPIVEAFHDAVMSRRISQLLSLMGDAGKYPDFRRYAELLLRADIQEDNKPEQPARPVQLESMGKQLAFHETVIEAVSDESIYEPHETLVQESRSDWDNSALAAQQFFESQNISTKKMLEALEEVDDFARARNRGVLVAGLSSDAVMHFDVISNDVSAEHGIAIATIRATANIGLRYVTYLKAFPSRYERSEVTVLSLARRILDDMKNGRF